MASSLNQDLYNSVAEITQMEDRLRACRERTSAARLAETAALNALNEAQKRFDDLAAQVRKGASNGSDWKRPAG